jgi:membrane-associated phospholipid phosphatase
MKRLSWLSPSLAAAALLAPAPGAASPHGWGHASDIGRDVLVASALGVPALHGDWSGDLQAGASILVAGGLVEGLKRILPEERPDHSDRRSFPSGHTAQSFAAAATLENRYGWRAGLPAFALASFVGLARVDARKHHWYDVVAGAAVGTGSGLLLTTKRASNVRLVPWADGGGAGAAFSAHF